MEYWNLFDRNRNLLERKVIRGEKLEYNEYHLVVNAWIKNKKGEFLITQRSENKPHPLMWECTGGSALLNESSIDAAMREIKEELGINVDKTTGLFMGSTLRYYNNCNDILDVWLFESDVSIDDVVIQKEEVCSVKWVSVGEIKKLYDEGKFEANAFFDVILDSTSYSKEFNDIKKYIGQNVTVKIDRPFGSKHPKKDFIYPVNYGYIPNTVSGDGEEVDAYVLGVFEPIEEFSGKVIAVIHRTNDNDDKLIVTKDGVNYSDSAIKAITEFQEKYFDSIIIR